MGMGLSVRFVLKLSACLPVWVLIAAALPSQEPNRGGEQSKVASSDALSDLLPREGQVSPVAGFRVSLSPSNAKAGELVTFEIVATVKSGWHIGVLETEAEGDIGLPTAIDFTPVGLVAKESKFKCSKQPEKIAVGESSMLCLSDTFTWSRQFTVAEKTERFSCTGSIRFQACNEETCQPPKTLKFSLGEQESASNPEPAKGPESNEKGIGQPLVLSLEPVKLTRPRPQISITSLLAFGTAQDDLVWKARIPTGTDTGVDLYLPKARRYKLKNTGNADTITESTATYVSIDQNADSVISSWESCSSGSPIRVHDSMFRIVAIDQAKSTITVQQLDMPLSGTVVGRKSPEFEYTTLDGKTISNKTVLGTTTILDVWAVTCHNCYEGFPHVQRMQDKYGADKLKVVLISVDFNQDMYDSMAPKLFEEFGGSKWPSVRVPNAFASVLPIGDFGFGSVVIDHEGIVRAIGTRGEKLEATLAEIFAD